jgi:very-short-patch-repair endonuclease
MYWDGLKGPTLTPEFKAIPGRKFAFDFAEPTSRVLIEIQGGIWTKGGHSSGTGISRDCEKSRLAQLHGWCVFAFTAADINIKAMEPVIQFTKHRARLIQ